MENKKDETPAPYDPDGKGTVGEGRGAPEAPIRNDPRDVETEKAPTKN